MLGKGLSAAVLAAVFGANAVLAQELSGPAELPPASYKGQQYVDSRGCVFLRAGYGGQVTWVPRVSRDRKQLCGYPSSGGQVEVAESSAVAPKDAAAAASAAPEVKPKTVVVETAPKKSVPAPKTKVVTAAPKAAAKAPAPTVVRPATPTELAATETGGTVVAAPESGAGYRLACPADTPVAQRFAIHGSTGTKVMCTRGDGSLDGANFPILVAGSLAGHPVGYDAHVAAGNGILPVDGGATYAKIVEAPAKSTKSAKYPDPAPPAGYKLAWSDDRLNPNRGKQTVEGFMAMDEIWTRTVPAELREDSDIARKPVTIIVRRQNGTQTQHEGYVLSSKGGKKVVITDPDAGKVVSKSTKAVAPEAVKPAKPKADAGRFLVQVGTFGVKSNAEGAAGRLKGMGLPVARAKLKGGALTVVYAGPFGSAADAKAALSAARGAGFSDAVIVQ